MQKHGDQYLIAMFSPFGGNQGENNSQKAKLVLPNHVLHSPNLLAVFKEINRLSLPLTRMNYMAKKQYVHYLNGWCFK